MKKLIGKFPMENKKHDLELEKMAKKLMSSPWNKLTVDKSHVFELLYNWNDFFGQIKKKT